MNWNGDCKVEGCERECVDSSGYCKQHKEAGQLRQQLAAERGASHHMEACRALLKVPDDEVLYVAIEELQQQLAAEREQVIELTAKNMRQEGQFREQLAAEQLNVNGLRNRLGESQQKLADREKCLTEAAAQLAAEREDIAIHFDALQRDLEQSRSQLAAEQENVKLMERMLTDSIDQMRKDLATERENKDGYSSGYATAKAEYSAQLAAERLDNKHFHKEIANWITECDKLKQQLAAEREWQQEVLNKQADENVLLKHQLADERENVKFLERNREIYVNDNRKVHAELSQLREQLAAAVELLGECRTKLDWHVADHDLLERIDALAKLGDGK